MHRYLLLVVLAVQAAFVDAGAQTAGRVFASAPDKVMGLLPAVTRLDMLDYYRYGSEKASINALGGNSRVIGETENDIRWRLSDNATMQLAVLTAGNDTVYALVETLALPAPDSRITLYDKSWTPLKKQFEAPRRADWHTPEGHRHADELEVLMPFDLVSADIDLAAGTLTLTNMADRYLVADDYDRVKDWVKPQITYSIQGTKFKLVK